MAIESVEVGKMYLDAKGGIWTINGMSGELFDASTGVGSLTRKARFDKDGLCVTGAVPNLIMLFDKDPFIPVQDGPMSRKSERATSVVIETDNTPPPPADPYISGHYSHASFNKLIEETFDSIRELSTLKGGEYAGDSDRLANFRRNAAEAEVPMELIWRIYTAKHWDAIMQYIKDLMHGTQRVRLEGLQSRCDDIIVYMLLFKAMLRERGVK